MEQSAMIVLTVWQNAIYIFKVFIYFNKLSLEEILDHFHNIHRENV